MLIVDSYRLIKSKLLMLNFLPRCVPVAISGTNQPGGRYPKAEKLEATMCHIFTGVININLRSGSTREI